MLEKPGTFRDQFDTNSHAGESSWWTVDAQKQMRGHAW
jgi:hypothetical protein